MADKCKRCGYYVAGSASDTICNQCSIQADRSTSSAPFPADSFQAFSQKIQARLAKGAEEYGNKADGKPMVELVAETQEELEDVLGWAFWIWRRLEKTKADLERVRDKQNQLKAYESLLDMSKGIVKQ